MSTPYSLPEGLFYLDDKAAAAYAANGGEEVLIRQLVKLPVGETLDAWIKHAWLAGTEKELIAGEGRGYVNHERIVAGLGVQEQIVSAGLPSASDASGAVPSIQYKVTAWGPLPIVDHIGLVRFVPVESQTTEIVWTIKLTLAVEGSAVFADPKALAPFLVGAIGGLLASVAVKAEGGETTP